jgi:hypothetical protein
VLWVVAVFALSQQPPTAVGGTDENTPDAPAADDGVFDVVTAHADHFLPGEPRVLSKKEEWLREKTLRPDFHTSDADLTRHAVVANRRTARKARGAAAEAPEGRAGDHALQRLDARSAAHPPR